MDKKNGFSMKMVEDLTCESGVQGNEVKPQVVKFLLAQSSSKQEKSFPIESRVQGNEVKPKQGCDNFQHRDKPQEAGDGFQQADKKNGLSMEMAEDQTCESRVQGNEVKPQEDCDNFQHRDENNGG